MAGFALPAKTVRLPHAQGEHPGREMDATFKVMERKLYRIIMTPAIDWRPWILGL